VNVPAKFEVFSLIVPEIIMWYQKIFCQPLDTPTLPLLQTFKLFNGLWLLFGLILCMFRPNLKYVALSVPEIIAISDWNFGWGLRTPNYGEEEAVRGRRWYRSKERW